MKYEYQTKNTASSTTVLQPPPFDDDKKSDKAEEDDNDGYIDIEDDGSLSSWITLENNDNPTVLLLQQQQQQQELRQEELQQRSLVDFDLPVDPGYRATRLQICCSFARPHMRAFHGSWACLAAAWLVWFSMAPLLSVIAEHSIPMTALQIWLSHLCSLAGASLVGLILSLGPLCHEYGGRCILIGLLVVCAIPAGLAGLLIHNYTSLLIVRMWIGCVGGALVPAHFWMSLHFTSSSNTSGVAIMMATAAGWGAAGGGLAQVLTGSVLYPAALHLTNGNADLSWRLALTVPAAMALATAAFFWYNSEDSPLGSYATAAKKAGLLPLQENVSATAASFRSGVLKDINLWIFVGQCGAAVGVELILDSCLTQHLLDRFSATQTIGLSQAAALASMYGGMNIVTRGAGGWLSNALQRRYSFRGRLYGHGLLQTLQGMILLAGFGRPHTPLLTTCLYMVALATAGQMSMGTLFGMVPYLDDPRSTTTGTIIASSIVGAGGMVGGVVFAAIFAALAASNNATANNNSTDEMAVFRIMGWSCCAAAALTPLVVVKGYRGILWGTEQQQQQQPQQTPTKDKTTTGISRSGGGGGGGTDGHPQALVVTTQPLNEGSPLLLSPLPTSN